MPWWGWIGIGMLLLAAELFIIEADFYLVFLGIAAALTGLLGLEVPDLPAWGQWLVFAVLALVSMVLFRKRVYRMLRREVADLPNDMLREQVALPDGLPVGLPDEFAFYMVGAIHYHQGWVQKARVKWEEVLALPPEQRRYRSTWAAFMLAARHDAAGAETGRGIHPARRGTGLAQRLPADHHWPLLYVSRCSQRCALVV